MHRKCADPLSRVPSRPAESHRSRLGLARLPLVDPQQQPRRQQSSGGLPGARATTGRHWCACSTPEFRCDEHAPATAREWGLSAAAAVLRAGDDELAGALELVISELVTNALRAHCDAVRVNLNVDAEYIRFGVEDDAPGRPTLLRPAPTDVHGRRLAIVTMLAEQWGVRALSAGKEVWAELRAD